MSALVAGTVLDGRYTVVRLIAEGGMSEVYEVSDARLPGRFALKRMRDLVGDRGLREEMTAQFEREAKVLATLSHAYLPRVTDHFLHEERPCLVEAFVDGSTLEDLEAGRRTPFNDSDVLGWADQICDALSYLHSKGIIYRDLKPSNCMIGRDGAVKLIDFGIVRFFTSGKSRDTVIMGTPGFAAPEQYGRDQTDARADIFALGVLLHHLLTGHDPTLTPFVFPAPRLINPLISERLEQVLMKVLALNPAERFETVADMRRALKGEAVIMDEMERYVYAEELPSPRHFVLQGLGVVGMGGGAAWLMAANIPFAIVGAFYMPLWLFLLIVQFVGRKRRASARIEVSRDRICYRQGARRVDVPWAGVRRLTFARDAFFKVAAANVSTDAGDFSFVVEGTRSRLNDAFDIPALEGSTRLCELIIRNARLLSTRPAGDEYVPSVAEQSGTLMKSQSPPV